MSTCWSVIGLLSLVALAASPGHAQESKKPSAANPMAVSTPSSPSKSDTGIAGENLSKQQAQIVQKVTLYFDQITALKGSFVQTGADSKRQRGKFYIKRPGLFRFDYALPSKLVILSDGTYVSIQDLDLGTDQRWELDQTPFRMLLRKDVDLKRDAQFFDIQEIEDTIAISFAEKGADAANRINLVLAKKPSIQLREWTAKDAQGYDTHVAVSDLAKAEDVDPALFDPAAVQRSR
jgi:outer membrane lipoprotein-sorting protein